MAPPSKLPGFFDIVDATHVRCTTCARHSSRTVGSILRTSIQRHIIGEPHQLAVSTELRQQEELKRRQQLLRSQLNGPQPAPTFNIPQFVAQPTEIPLQFDDHSAFYDQELQMVWEPNNTVDTEAEAAMMDQALETFGILDPDTVAARLGYGYTPPEAVDEDSTLTNVMESLALQDPVPAEAVARALGQFNTGNDATADYAPYPNKIMFLLDVMDNLPRLRLSDSHMKLFLFILSAAGCQGVPTFSALRKMQSELQCQGSVRTKQYQSSLGHIFYQSDIGDIMAKDFANPKVRPHMRFYPEVPANGVVSEAWHATKWHTGIALDKATPMAIHKQSLKHFYVQELAQLESGELVLPVRWIVRQNELCADAHRVQCGQNAKVVDRTSVINVRLTDLRLTLPELLKGKGNLLPDDRDLPGFQVNPLRKKAAGRALYTVFFDAWGDDVSGNKSKSYNLHNNIYGANRCLPRRLLQQEFHVHFISTSQHASVPQQFSAVKEQIQQTLDEPREAWDCESQSVILFRLALSAGPADNPMQSDLCGHIGMHSNKFCRKCKVGGSTEEKASNEGFKQLFQPGERRTVTETLQDLEAQFDAAASGAKPNAGDLQTLTGTKCKVAQHWIERVTEQAQILRREQPALTNTEIKQRVRLWLNSEPGDKMGGSLLIPDFDPNSDTPVEILHTVLLGVVKYTWHLTHSPWKADKKDIFTKRLQSTNTDGLSIPPIRAAYVIQYANSLIGRQFKMLMQTVVFHLDDLVPLPVLDLWKAVGELVPFLWIPEIADMTKYETDLKQAVDNVLDVFAAIDPNRILSKGKLHNLTHVLEDVRRFGPVVGCSTEIFECWNAIFRMCSILSNGLAASRDIGQRLVRMEGVKQRVTGGYWKSQDALWVCASQGVTDFFKHNPILQAHLGWTEDNSPKPGTIRLESKQRHGPSTRPWTATQASSAVHAVAIPTQASQLMWSAGISVVAESGDVCKINSWVFVQKSPSQLVIGQIAEIANHSTTSLITVKQYTMDGERDTRLGMPYIRRGPEDGLIVVCPQHIIFLVNVQHDCRQAGCTASGTRAVYQERLESGVTEQYIKHNDVDLYFLNTTALHNAHHLRRTLPQQFTTPIPYFSHLERSAKHDELAAELRDFLLKKKQEAAKNRAAKKAAKEVGETVQQSNGRPSKKRKVAVLNDEAGEGGKSGGRGSRGGRGGRGSRGSRRGRGGRGNRGSRGGHGGRDNGGNGRQRNEGDGNYGESDSDVDDGGENDEDEEAAIALDAQVFANLQESSRARRAAKE